MILYFDKIDLSVIKNRKIKAILICLFTDARAVEGELPSYIHENRGWWGDGIEVSIKGKKELIRWGSLMWVLRRAKLSDELLIVVQEYIKQSLNPLLRSGYISEPEIVVSRNADQLNFVLQFHDEVLEIRNIKL